MTLDNGEIARELHRRLMRLAGRLPDDLLANLRRLLAVGDCEAVGEMSSDLEAAVLDRQHAFVFAAGNECGPWPPLLDLTLPGSSGQDEVDHIAVRAAAALRSAVALRRSSRLPSPGDATSVRIFLLEVSDDDADLPAATAEIMAALDGAAVNNPMVEVYVTGADLPPYHQGALAAAALLWTAAEAPVMRIARTLDGGGQHGPRFDEGHRLDGDERAHVLSYLENGVPVLATTQRSVDVLEPQRGDVVPLGFRTDGRWIWTDSASYHLRVHGLAPDADLLADIRASGYALRPAGAADEHRALAALFASERSTSSS